MPHMLTMPTSQVGHPITLFVLMIADDRLIHDCSDLWYQTVKTGRGTILPQFAWMISTIDQMKERLWEFRPLNSCTLSLPHWFNAGSLERLVQLYEPRAVLIPQPDTRPSGSFLPCKAPSP